MNSKRCGIDVLRPAYVGELSYDRSWIDRRSNDFTTGFTVTIMFDVHARTVFEEADCWVASMWDLPDVINCQFREHAITRSGPVHSLSSAQQSGIYCLIICGIQLLTPNNLHGTWRRICSPDIRSVSALEVLRYCALKIDIYLLTYLLSKNWETGTHYRRRCGRGVSL